MKEIVASDLKEVLNRICSALTNNGMIEGSDKIGFSDGKVYTFDGETYIQADFDIGINGAINGNSLLKYVEKLSSSKIEIEQTNDSVVFRKGKSVASFIVDESAKSPVEFENIQWSKPAGNLIPALQMCAYTCGKDHTDLRTTVIHIKDGVCESTDEERITRFNLDAPMTELYIPVELVKVLAKSKIIEVGLTDDWTIFKNQEGDIICHRIVAFGDDYQDIGAIVDECKDGEAIAFPEKLYDAVEKAAVFQSDLKVESERKITVKCKENKIRVESDGSYGKFRETIATENEKEFTFTINPQFLCRIMESKSDVFIGESFIRVETDDYVFLTSICAE